MSGAKTEKPTAKRLREARKQGDVAKSRDVPSALLLLGFAFLLAAGGPYYADRMKALLEQPFHCMDAGGDCISFVASQSMAALFQLSLPALAVAILLSVLGHIGQAGWVFSLHPVKPDPGRLNPAANLGQLFSPENLFGTLLNVAKLAALAFLFWIILAGSLDALIKTPLAGAAALPGLIAAIMKKIFLYAVPLFAALAAADFFYRRFRYLEKKKMSKEEVTQEYKEMEGDPHIKSKRRQLHQEMLTHDTLERIRKASVLITNPTHFAVALFYDENEGGLPVVLGKGEGWLAQRMMQVAAEEGIPVMRDVPLARALYAEGGVDRYIPSSFIRPVAETLKWAREMRRDA